MSTPTAVSVPEDAEVLLIPLQLNGPGRQCVVTVSTLDGTAISTGKELYGPCAVSYVRWKVHGVGGMRGGGRIWPEFLLSIHGWKR